MERQRENPFRKDRETAGAIDQKHRPSRKPPPSKRAAGNPAVYICAGIAVFIILFAVLMGNGKKDDQIETTRPVEAKSGTQERRATQAEQLPILEGPKDEKRAALAAQNEREQAVAAEIASRPRVPKESSVPAQPTQPVEDRAAQSSDKQKVALQLVAEGKARMGFPTLETLAEAQARFDQAEVICPGVVPQKDKERLVALKLTREGWALLKEYDSVGAKQKFAAANALVPKIAPGDEDIKGILQEMEQARRADAFNRRTGSDGSRPGGSALRPRVGIPLYGDPHPNNPRTGD